MPRLEGITPNATVERDAREAHLIRLQNDLAQFRQLLKQVPAEATKEHPQPQQERQTIDAQIALWEEQLKALQAKGPIVLAKQDQEISQLKDEVAALREALTEATGKLQKMQTAPGPDAV